jgi:Protein of unknown function (DUF4240)
MLWTTIDALRSENLRERARELENSLDILTDPQVVQFQNEAVSAFRLIFRSAIRDLYCAAFEGEVNDMGFADMCSNLILARQTLYKKVAADPDAFAEVPNVVPFNDDYVSVGDIGVQKLAARLGNDAVELKVLRGEIQTLHGIWKDYESQYGKFHLGTNWSAVRGSMPRVYARWGSKRG